MQRQVPRLCLPASSGEEAHLDGLHRGIPVLCCDTSPSLGERCRLDISNQAGCIGIGNRGGGSCGTRPKQGLQQICRMPLQSPAHHMPQVSPCTRIVVSQLAADMPHAVATACTQHAPGESVCKEHSTKAPMLAADQLHANATACTQQALEPVFPGVASLQGV